jgi:hypothetical protein
MATLHAMYKHSVTIHTDDLAVVNCLRALSELSQRTGNNRIPWGGTKDRDWKRDAYCTTFRFTTADYRASFLLEVKGLLPQHLWSVVRQSDSDPARPQ